MNQELTKFSTHELETELLSRKICQVNKPGCQKKAVGYFIKQFGFFIKQIDGWQIQTLLICFNCQDYLKKTMNYEKP